MQSVRNDIRNILVGMLIKEIWVVQLASTHVINSGENP